MLSPQTKFSLKKMRNQIKNAEIVSFDIFDTLILRKYANPTDMFYHMEYILEEPGFAERRITVEGELRESARKEGREEINYNEIYSVLGNDKAKSLELELEYNGCIRNNEMYDIYMWALKLKKTIYFTSDMYLPSAFIKRILKHCGYDQYSNLFISSDDYKSKYTSTRFTVIKNLLEPNLYKKFLHIGDNLTSDFIVPKKLGFKAFHYTPPKISCLVSKNISKNVLAFFAESQTLVSSVFWGIISSRNANNGESYWYWFGYQYSGLIIYAFCKWLLQELLKEKINDVFFLARDGQIIKKVFDILKPKELRSEYMLASRRCLILPSLDNLDLNNQLDFFTTAYFLKYPKDYITRLGSTIDNDLKKKMADYNGGILNRPIYRIPRFKNLINDFFNTVKPELYSIITEEKKVLLEYMKNIGFVKPRVAVVDIGWRGNMQNAIVKIFENEQCRPEIYGYYLGTLENENKIITKGFILNNGKPESNCASINCDIIETFTMADHLGINKIIKNKNGTFEPVHTNINRHELKRINIAKDVQRGILDFTLDMKSVDFKYSIDISSDEIANFLKFILSNFSKYDIKHLKSIMHPTDLGNPSVYRPVLFYTRYYKENNIKRKILKYFYHKLKHILFKDRQGSMP
jgi:predicted HAD superfamily hydrolase